MNTRKMRITVQLDGDVGASTLTVEVPEEMAEISRRLMMNHISLQVDWMAGYDRAEDQVNNSVELNASILERRHRLGLDTLDINETE
jgi:hypothetical protein